MPSFQSKNHLVRLMLSVCLATVGAVATVAPGAAQFVVVCDALTIDELNDLSSLQYDSASRQLGGCTYAPPSEEGANHSLTVNLAPIGSIKELTEVFTGGEKLTVVERPAYDIDGQLWVQLKDGTVAIEASIGDGPSSGGVDALAYATLIAQIVVPRLDEAMAAAQVTAGDVADPVEAAPAEATLCDAISTEEINALGPLQYGDPFTANATACTYQASDLQEGSHSVSLFREELIKFDDLMMFNPGGEDLTIADHRAYAASADLYVDADDFVLTVVANFAGSPAAEGMDPIDHAIEVAEIAMSHLEDAE